MAKAKPIAKLNCLDAAVKVIPRVLQARMKKMGALRAHALNWDDPEGVHDMRVASRRLRSALSDFKPYLRRGSMPINRLKSIAKNLGVVRDQDVAIAALDELRSKADGKVGKGIEAIADERRRERRQARALLEHVISVSAITELRNDFRTRLRTATKVPGDTTARDGSNQGPTFSQAGVNIIGHRLKQLREAGDSIYRPLGTQQLHRMRILAKRLRYAVELFTPCWGDELKKAAAEIACFQTSLGELHDCDVWIASLGARLTKDHDSDINAGHDRQNQEAVVWLLDHFVSERTQHYRETLARWDKWEREGFLDRLKALLDTEIAPPTELPQNETRLKASRAIGKIHTRKLASSSRQ